MANKVEVEVAGNGWILYIHSSFSTRTEAYNEWPKLMMALNRELHLYPELPQK